MHRIYCDSNAYRVIKPDHRYFNMELLKTFSDLKEVLLFVFSDAHLDDLKESKYKDKTDEDLDLIGDYCKDNYFSFDYGGEKVLKLYFATPKEAYYSKDYEAAERAVHTAFDFDNLFEDFDDDPQLQGLKSLMKSYMNLPISLWAPPVDTSNFDEKSKEMYERMLPHYSPDMSIGDFINSFMPYGAKLLNDKQEFTELRKYSSAYINSEEFSFKKWGLDFNQKLKESVFGKTFTEMLDSILIDAHKKDPHYKFTYAYALLELYGIVQERTSNNKLKKFTYDSLNRDASHAFFASYSDYLVTDDKGLQVKAQILYHLFGIETQIFSTRDFINHRSLWLANEETYSSFSKSFEHDMKHSFQVLDHTDIGTGENMKEFKTTHPYFNYFNRFQIITGNTSVYAFFCKREQEKNLFLYREIELLTNKMLEVFGIDDENKGPFDMEEAKTISTEYPVRTWTLSSIRYSLMISQLHSGNYIVLGLKLLK